MIQSLWQNSYRSLLFPWVVLFLFANLLVTQLSNTNAKSRIASLRAVTEGHSLHINNYKDWTIDWSLAPNGNIYSNKAPGGMLLGLPIFWPVDAIASLLHRGPLDSQGRRPEPGYVPMLLLVLCTQILPFGFLVLKMGERMRAWGFSTSAIHFFGLASLFGNTAAIYMNSYFGHGLAAVLFLAFALAWYDRNYFWAALYLSFALLTDYVAVVAIPIFALLTLWRERASWNPLFSASLGALPGAVLWIWYHQVAFGSPFAFATKFNNPELIEQATASANPEQGFGFWPDFSIVFELLFGASRGLLFTQPWVLIVAFTWPLFFTSGRALLKNQRELALLTVITLLALVWLNASYGAWHGGWCAGPRYLAIVFPALALVAAILHDRHPRLRVALWLTLAVALAFRVFILPHSILAPNISLWAYYYGLYLEGRPGTLGLRLGLILLATVSTLAWLRQRKHLLPS